MNNQFQDFSNRMIAKHKGFGQTFDSAPMVFPEQESAGETGGTSIENHYIKNLYQIQNLTEENHLYHQNLRFVTNILEKKLEQRVVPSVEKLVERTIQEELPGVEKQIVHEMAERLHTLVKEGGVKELTMLREQLYKETERQKEQLYRETEKQKEQLYRETERQEKLLHKETEVRTEKLAGKLERELRITERLNKTEHEIQTEERKLSVEQNRHTETTNLTEQEILLRKIENIYYSSTQNHFYGNAEQAGEQTENSPERTKVWTRKLQTQALQTSTLQTPILEAQKAPQRSFDFLHLEYGVQDPAEETANIQAQSPDTPEFLKQQERVLEQQREIIARQFRSLTQQAEGAVVARNKEQQEPLLLQQTVSAIQNKPQLQSTTGLQNIEPSQAAAPLQNVESSQDAVSLQNVEPAQSEAREPDIYDKTLTVPEHRSRSIFRVEDLKRHQHQSDRTFQEAELLYSFEQTSDEHWNEIRQEIVKELREDKNREAEKPSEEPSVHQPTSTSVPRARQLADQIFRQAGENIRLQTGGTVTIHPAALEYLEQVLDTQSGQSKQAVQPVGKQLQLTDRKSSDENTVIHRVERILDAYRVRQEPVKAARSTKPKTMMTQAPAGVRSGEPGTMMVQQTPGQSGTVMVQQTPGQSGTVMVQQIPGQSGTVMVQQIPGQSETMMAQQIPGQSETVMVQQIPGQPETVMIQQTMAGQSGQPGAVRSQPQMTSRPGTEMLRIKSQMPQAIRLIQVPGISAGEVKAAMEQAPMIYPEEVSPQEQAEQNQNLQKQIHEITQDIKEVKKTTVVRQETLTEQQKEVVREVIRQAPETVKEKDVSTLIRRQVQREVETQVDASLGQMTNRVYRRIEEKLRTERGRRGLL
jgi:hypothetical protein